MALHSKNCALRGCMKPTVAHYDLCADHIDPELLKNYKVCPKCNGSGKVE